MKEYTYKFILFLLALVIHSNFSFSQNTAVIKIKKEGETIIFFQEGKKCDTIYATKNNLFCLQIPDSLKEVISLRIDNAQLLPTKTKGLYKLNYVAGIAYECMFVEVEDEIQSKPKSTEIMHKNREFKSFVNGASNLALKKIKIEFFNTQKQKQVFEFNYDYKE